MPAQIWHTLRGLLSLGVSCDDCQLHLVSYILLRGGFLVGHLLSDGALDQVEAGSHFDKNLPFGTYFHERYAGMLGPVRALCDVVVRISAHHWALCHFHRPFTALRSHNSRQQEKHGLNLNQASVRWLQHHSAMIPSDLGIIFGGSKPSHIDKTLEYKSVY